MMNYIATRDGVELGSIELDSELQAMQNSETFDKELYAKYVATRPGVVNGETVAHGLFGRFDNMDKMDDIRDLGLALGYIENLAHSKKTIYNAVISMKEEDAAFKNMTNRTAWAEFVNNHINDISREMDINPRTMEWVAAVHMEKGHPHLHLMYWDTAQTIGKNFISAKQSNAIRHKLTNDLYHDELLEIRKEKDSHRKLTVDGIQGSDDSILKKAVKGYGSLTNMDIYKLAQSNVTKSKILNRHTANNNQQDLIEKLLDLKAQIKKEYPKGALKYKYMPPKIKAALKQLTAEIISGNPDIAREYDKFIKSASEQAKLYGGKQTVDNYVAKEKAKIFNQICNKILFSVKQMQFIEEKKLPSGQKQAEQEQYHYSMIGMNLMQSVLDVIAQNNNAQNSNSKTFGKDLSKAEKKELAKEKKDSSIDWEI